eukprot:g15913.t1
MLREISSEWNMGCSSGNMGCVLILWGAHLSKLDPEAISILCENRRQEILRRRDALRTKASRDALRDEN